MANEALSKTRKEEQRLAKKRREEKFRAEAEWDALYGAGRVEEEGRGNEEGWDEDGFM